MLATHKKLFYINSRNRLSGTDSNFYYKFDIEPDSKYTDIAVLQMVVPKSYYLVQDQSNTFILEENSQATITIPEGNYSRQSLQTVVQSLLNSASPNGWAYTVSYPTTSSIADTGKYTFSVTGNGGVQPKFIFTTYVYEILGFSKNSTNTFSSDTLTSTNVIKLTREDTLFLHSDICLNEGGGDDILQEIFTSTGNAFLSNVHFENKNVEAYSKKIASNNSQVFRFKLTNEDGDEIELNGQNMVITLLLYQKANLYDVLVDLLKINISN